MNQHDTNRDLISSVQITKMQEHKAQKGNKRPSANKDEIRPSSNFNEYLTNVKQVLRSKK